MSIALGVNHQIGVRVEGQHRALATEHPCAPHDAADQVLVAVVNAIKGADRQHRRALVDRLRETLDKFHNYSNRKEYKGSDPIVSPFAPAAVGERVSG